ncbi:MAG: YgiQ family radical SAM protein [Bacteroidales bacterium]|nr:YgiQ family radical SAM protein [Bacteroidales bacterium]
MRDLKAWLPITKKELTLRGWEEVDVVLVTGDAYVDHPAFGCAILGRIIENEGFKVAILPQPNWQDDQRDFKKFGKPRLFFGITSGAMDSMVNHYTAAKRLRSTDAYTAGDKAGFRPDYATTVYSRIIRHLYPDSLIILGGIEASLRRLTHYDYWSNQLMPSILAESGADLLVYGMGEKSIKDILNVFRVHSQPKVSHFYSLPQIAYIIDNQQSINKNSLILHSHEKCLQSKEKFAENFKNIETESNKYSPSIISQNVDNKTVIVNPPYPPLSESELDAVYELPFTRLPHPKYEKRGEIPAFIMIQNSVNIHRGCFGGCSFCTISAHQGKFIASRSEKSILKEVQKITELPYFKGYISDLGGPSANMYQMGGKNKKLCRQCQKPSCLFPKICNNLNYNHLPLLQLYKKANNIPKIKKITIGSGIRYDMLLPENQGVIKEYALSEYTNELIKNHVSGRLKVAPEHTEEHVLQWMRKPNFAVFLQFKDKFDQINAKFHLKQQLIPYFISSHPGCSLKDMQNLSRKIRILPHKLEQVQDFTPTPMTLSSVIFYTGFDPYTHKKIYCASNIKEKQTQKEYFL